MLAQRLRFLVAFALAPVGVCGLLTATFKITDPHSNYRWVFLPMLLVMLGHSLLLGVPLAVRLRHLNRLTLRNTLVSGALIGSIPTTILLAWLQLRASADDRYLLGDTMLEIHGHLTVAGWLTRIAIAVVLAFVGILAASFWWIVAFGTRPNRWRFSAVAHRNTARP
jgi:hypothetical protein